MTTPSPVTAQQQPPSKPPRRSRNKVKADVPTKAATDQFGKLPAAKPASNCTASDNDLAHIQKEEAREVQQSSSISGGGSGSGNNPSKILKQALAAVVHTNKQVAQPIDCEPVADSIMPSRMPGRQQPSQQQQPWGHASSQEKHSPQQHKPANGKTDPTAKGLVHAKTASQSNGSSGSCHNNGSTSRPSDLPPASYCSTVSNGNGIVASQDASQVSSVTAGWEGKTSWEVETEKRHHHQQAATSQAGKKKYVDVAHSGSAKAAAAAQTAYRPKASVKQPAGGAEAFPPLPLASDLRPANADTSSGPPGAAATGSATEAEDRKVGAAASAQLKASVKGSSGGSDDSRPMTATALPGEASEGKAASVAPSSFGKGSNVDSRPYPDSRRQDWVPKRQQGVSGSRTTSTAPSSSSNAARSTSAGSGAVTSSAAASKQAVEGSKAPDVRSSAVPVAVSPAIMPPNPSSALAAKASGSAVQQQQPPQVPMSAPVASGLKLPSLQEVNMAVNSSRPSGTGSVISSAYQSLDGAAGADGQVAALNADTTGMQGSSTSSTTNRSSLVLAVGYTQQQQQQQQRQNPHAQLEPFVAPATGGVCEQPQASASTAVAAAGHLPPGQQQQHLPPVYAAGHLPILNAPVSSGGGSGGGNAAAISRRLSADAPPFVVARSVGGHPQPGPQGHEGRSSAGGLCAAANPATGAGDFSASARPGSAALSSAVLEQQWLENAKSAAACTGSGSSAGARPTSADAVASSSSSMGTAAGANVTSSRAAVLLKELSDAFQEEQQAWERQQAEWARKQSELLQQQQREAAGRGAAEKKVVEMEEALDAALKAAQEMEAKLSLQTSQVDTLKSDFATAMAAKHEACKEVAAAHSQASVLQQQLSELEAANVHLRQQLNDWQRSYAMVERENGQMRHLLGTNAPAPGSLPPAVALPSAPAAAGGGSDVLSDGSFPGGKGGAASASGAKAPPPGFGPVVPPPAVCTAQPEQQQVYIKNEHELVLTILPVLREGLENAVQWTAAELAAVNAQLVPLSWEGNYEPVYGTIDYFMQQRPAVFGCSSDGLFYKQPGAEQLVHSTMRREQEETAAGAAGAEPSAAAAHQAVPTQLGHGSWNQLPATDLASSGGSFQLPMDQPRLPGPGPASASALPATAASVADWGQPSHSRATGPPVAIGGHHAGAMGGPPPVSMAVPQQQFWPTSMPASAHVPVAMSMPAVAPLPFNTGAVPYPYSNTGYRNW